MGNGFVSEVEDIKFHEIEAFDRIRFWCEMSRYFIWSLSLLGDTLIKSQ